MSRVITFLILCLISILAAIGTIDTVARTGLHAGNSFVSTIVIIGGTLIFILMAYQVVFNTGGHQQTVTPNNRDNRIGQTTGSTDILDDDTDPFREDQDTFTDNPDPEHDDEFQEILNEIDEEIEDDWKR